MQRLLAVTYRLPYSPASTEFLANLRSLLTGVPYASAAPGRLQLTPMSPPGAFPVTAFEIAEIATPEIRFGTAWSLGVHTDSWSITPPPKAPQADRAQPLHESGARGDQADRAEPVHEEGAQPVHEDRARGGHAGRPEGDPGESGGDTEPAGAEAGVSTAELAARLAGHVEAVDHTGVNLPASALQPVRWRAIVAALAETSTFYRYPTGEPWLFLLPSTETEYADDIRSFVAGREPRFELVNDEWLTQPLWQFALRTDLSRAELEAMFPDPVGAAFPGLGDVFRADTVRSPWTDLQVRFDLYYGRTGTLDDWETGEWLVSEGGRIREDRQVRDNGG